MAERTFKHSGNLADIIYSLPAVKSLGGGVIFLDVAGGKSEPAVSRHLVDGRTRFSSVEFAVIKPLLLEQPLIRDVRVWNNEPVDFNLDSARDLPPDQAANLSALYLRRFGLNESLSDDPWLTLQSPPIKPAQELVINRTTRYQAKHHLWELNKQHWLPRAVFVGLPIEHEWFCHAFDSDIAHHRTDNALQIAQVLAGALQLVGNQGFVMAIAIGLGIPVLQEVHPLFPCCVFKRKLCQYF